MKKMVVVLLIGLLMVAALAVPALAKGGSSQGSDIWVYQGEDPGTLIKAIYKQTGSGIIHQWRYYPVDLHFVFKPASKFPSAPDEGGYFYWRFTASQYTETDSNPGSLSDYFTDGAYYWVKITVQD